MSKKIKRHPFMMTGCKVADGYGTMLATVVGINTEWGLLMASISEDTGEETPLQVCLNGVATFIGLVGLSVAAVVIAVLFVRFETFSMWSKYSSARVLGTIVCLTGAMAMSVCMSPLTVPDSITCQGSPNLTNPMKESKIGMDDRLLLYLCCSHLTVQHNSFAVVINFPALLFVCYVIFDGLCHNCSAANYHEGKMSIGSTSLSITSITAIVSTAWCINKKVPVMVSIYSPIQNVSNVLGTNYQSTKAAWKTDDWL